MTNDQHLAFGDLHALIVTDQKADEQQVSVHFLNGQMSVVLQKNGSTAALVPYRDVVRVTYVHAHAPKWDPTFAAPAANVSMPGGGLFRSDRHWLTLQAKATYVILRLNDDDFQRVLDAVTARMGLKVEQPTGD